MGDVPPQPSSTGDNPAQESLSGSHPGFVDAHQQQGYAPGRGAVDPSTTYTPPFPQQYGTPQHAFTSQFDMAHPQGQGRSGPYNMAAMANALPQTSYRPSQYNPSQQRFNPAAAAAAQGVAGQMQPLPQYGGQASLNPMAGQQYYMPQHASMGQYYGAPLSPSQQQATVSPRANVGYYPNQVVMNTQQQQHHPQAYYYTQAAHYPAQGQPLQGQVMPGQYLPSVPQADPRMAHSQAPDQTSGLGFAQGIDSRRASDARSNIVRGPPRKPKQSGHAIWIGNLPPQTDLMSLVHHVCKEAPGLESLFLISKSNCAFANYKDEPTCLAAQQKLHDSKFQSVRLVSRMRKATAEGATVLNAPTGPSGGVSQGSSAGEAAKEPPKVEVDGNTPTPGAGPSISESKPTSTPEGAPQKDKFFILKSLTVEDLELSVRTGIWATQSHNEDSLNRAFKAVDNVYLVFSANKSGEYFGYAKMTSAINEDPAAAIEFAPKVQTASDLDLPKAIPTEATEFAPKGRIIDDSARGTIFWEAERDEAEDRTAESETGSSGDDGTSTADSIVGGEPKAWGKPFKLEWLSTNRLPFYRTRGLRNPWNSNREVKIARDGTELEPSVGRRLIGLFNRVQSPAPAGGMRQGGMPSMMVGYPPMQRPSY